MLTSCLAFVKFTTFSGRAFYRYNGLPLGGEGEARGRTMRWQKHEGKGEARGEEEGRGKERSGIGGGQKKEEVKEGG